MQTCGAVTVEFEAAIKLLWGVLPNQQETKIPKLIQQIPSWASHGNGFQFFSTTRCSYNRLGFEADGVAK